MRRWATSASRRSAALANCSTEERAWRDAAQIATGDGGSDGSEGHAGASQDAPALKSLYLDFNNIGPDGAKHLARMIHLMDHRQACALTTLSLNNNRIGDEGAIALARAIRGNHSLQRIFLRDNGIGPAGSQVLAHDTHAHTRTHTHAHTHARTNGNGAGVAGVGGCGGGEWYLARVGHGGQPGRGRHPICTRVPLSSDNS